MVSFCHHNKLLVAPVKIRMDHIPQSKVQTIKLLKEEMRKH
jgi:hypothetical protein